ncbi:DUF4974 domain-containing protein [Pseudoflavitalea sp. X16]|uniref:FecR family protein n=1 Tax=Paraflavitalea devenefica TaxID=2716334 RepID=UPI00142340F8|nr:FecR family protein [Paraflavitalea devenefica]NII27781.1 DUF4974 domain-containing protein [Paraflavitalea devenefica]
MKNHQYSLLRIYLKRKEDKKLTAGEQRMWEQWRTLHPLQQEASFDELSLCQLTWSERQVLPWEQFKQKYNIDLPLPIAFPDDEKQSATVQSMRRWPTYRFLTVAASLIGVILAGLGWLLSQNKGFEETSTPTAAATVISPGSRKATLSLVDGQNRLGVPAGGEYSIELPDGTNVWLNAATAIRYPVAFGNGERIVELEEGEAYFEVAKKSPAQPFIVRVKGQTIQVLGTQFNVNAYKEEPAVTTTLVEGSVSLTNGARQKLLKPGQQAVINAKSITIQPVISIEEATAWKHKHFTFHNTRLSVIMMQVKRWYDVEEVVYIDPLNDEQFVIDEFPRSAPLTSLLENLEASRLVHFEVKGRKIYVSKQ